MVLAPEPTRIPHHHFSMDRGMETSACGWGSWLRPRWMQTFATPKCFLVMYILMAASKNGFDKYFRQTLTTLEKRFKLPSNVIGIIVSGNEVSMLLLCLVLAHYGGRGNRPLWISCGYATSAAASLLLALPHFIYGPGEAALSLTEEYLDAESLNATSHTGDYVASLCSLDDRTSDICDAGAESGGKEYSMTVVTILLLAHVTYGVGTSVYFTLLQTYMDDNAKKTESLVLLNIGSLGHAMSPIMYSSLASYCMKLYIDPFLTPVITNKDPRWMGAWWLGWLVMALFDTCICVLISLFPKEMKTIQRTRRNSHFIDMEKKQEEKENMLILERAPEEEKDPFIGRLNRKPSLNTGLTFTLRRILTNKALLFSTTSTLLTGFVNVGKNTFIMKYAEVQYEIPSSEVAMKIGAARTPVRIAGTLLIGILYAKLKPNASFVLGWSLVERLVKIATFALILLHACGAPAFIGADVLQTRGGLADNCSVNCGCEHAKYEPVCSVAENTTYFSPCYAGCSEMVVYEHRKHYRNCSCLPASSSDFPDSLKTGPCGVDCSFQLMMFMIAHYAYEFIQRTSAVGRKFFTLRCVATADKSVAQAVIVIFNSIFAFLPSPIVMGYIIDYACLVWDTHCGHTGNCWIYNKDQFRILFYGALTGLSILGAISDMKVWQLGRHIDFYKEEYDIKDAKKKQEHTEMSVL